MNTKEVWKDVKNYEGHYQVSNLGNVKSLDKVVTQKTKYNTFVDAIYRGKELRKEILKGGYLRVTLSKSNKQKRITIHRLVALAFIDNIENKKYVNHKDGNTNNNNILNLEWCTSSENELHSYDVLGKINPIRKLTNHQVIDIKKNAIKRVNINSYAIKYNVHITTILNILNNKTYV